MVWSVQKSGLEIISGWMCVRAYIKTSKNSNVYISGITQPIEMKFGMEVKPKCPFFGRISVAIDLRIEILWSFEFFFKCLPQNFERPS